MMKWLEERRELRRMIEARLTKTKHMLSDTRYAEEKVGSLLGAHGYSMTPAEVLCVRVRLAQLLIKRIHIGFSYDTMSYDLRMPWHVLTPLVTRRQWTDFHDTAAELAFDAIDLSEDFKQFFVVLNCLIAVNNYVSADDSIEARVRYVSTWVSGLYPYDDSVDGILRACSDLQGRQQFAKCITADDAARFRFENDELLSGITDDVEALCMRLLSLG